MGPTARHPGFLPRRLYLAVSCLASVFASLSQFPHATCQVIFLASYYPASDSIPGFTSQSCPRREQRPGSQDTHPHPGATTCSPVWVWVWCDARASDRPAGAQ